MAARMEMNGRREEWINVAFWCVYVAVLAMKMTGVRRHALISDELSEMVEGILEVHEPEDDDASAPFRDDGSVLSASDRS